MSELTWGRRLGLGAVAGAAGGIASALLLWVLVEPTIARAILIEEAQEGGPTHSHEAGAEAHEHAEVVTRLQQQIGGTVAVIVVAVLLGLVFAVTYARVSRRLPGSTDLGRSFGLAGLAFTVIAVVPSLIVPANPPGVGSSETVNQRTLAYLTVILLSGVFVCAIFALDRAMGEKGLATGLRWSVLALIVTTGAVIVLLAPHTEEPIPTTMPADLVWEFRTGSLAQLASMWAAIGVVHGFLLHRRRSPVRAYVASALS